VGLLATVKGKGKSSKVTWKSSNSSIASVSKTGIVTGLSMLMTGACHRQKNF